MWNIYVRLTFIAGGMEGKEELTCKKNKTNIGLIRVKYKYNTSIMFVKARQYSPPKEVYQQTSSCKPDKQWNNFSKSQKHRHILFTYLSVSRSLSVPFSIVRSSTPYFCSLCQQCSAINPSADLYLCYDKFWLVILLRSRTKHKHYNYAESLAEGPLVNCPGNVINFSMRVT